MLLPRTQLQKAGCYFLYANMQPKHTFARIAPDMGSGAVAAGLPTFEGQVPRLPVQLQPNHILRVKMEAFQLLGVVYIMI